MIATPLAITAGILLFCGVWSFPLLIILEARMRYGVVILLAGFVCMVAALFIGSLSEGWFA